MLREWWKRALYRSAGFHARYGIEDLQQQSAELIARLLKLLYFTKDTSADESPSEVAEANQQGDETSEE